MIKLNHKRTTDESITDSDTGKKHIDANDIKTERKLKIFSARNILFLIISVILAAFLLHQISIQKTLKILVNADPLLLIAAFLIYFISNYFKSVRYSAMMETYHISAFNMFSVTAYQNFFNQILPARTGELTLIYYLKKTAGTDVPKGLHILLITRIYDLIIVAIFFISSVFIYFGRNASQMLLIAGICLLIFSIVSLFNLKLIARIVRISYNWSINQFGLSEKPVFVKLKENIEILESEFSSYDTVRQSPLLIFTSILVWITQYALAYFVIISLNINIGLVQSIVGSTGQVMANVLPVNSFGSIGTLEAGWTAGYLFAKMGLENAVISGLGYHIITIMSSLVLALLCYVIMKSKPMQKN